MKDPVTHTRASKMGTIVPYRPQTMEVGPQILRLLFITTRLRLWEIDHRCKLNTCYDTFLLVKKPNRDLLTHCTYSPLSLPSIVTRFTHFNSSSRWNYWASKAGIRPIPFYDFALFVVFSLFTAGSPIAGKIFSASVGRTTREKREDNK